MTFGARGNVLEMRAQEARAGLGPSGREGRPLVTGKEDLVAALAEFVPRAMSGTAVPGVSVAISRSGESLLEESFGLADIATERPMTTGTVFWAGSMSKLYTGVAALQMVEAGRLALDEPVQDYLAFPFENPLGDRPVTVRDLLMHRSGLTSDTGGCDHRAVAPLEPFLCEGAASETLDEYEHSIRRWSSRVGEKWQYSNFGIALLGYAVERVDPQGRSCAKYITEQVLEPLGMTSSAFPPSENAAATVASIPDFASGYAGYGSLLVATPPIRFASYPAGALLTTPSDHQRLLLALAGGGSYDNNRILTSASVDEMLEPAIKCGENLYTGLVARISNRGTIKENFGHWGAYMWGWWNGSAVYPKLDLAITVCTNRWDMVRYLDPGALEAPRLIIDFAADWCARDAIGLPLLPSRSWAWKTSYLAGLSMAERTKGVLGIADALGSDVLEKVVTTTHSQERWDADGFRAGVTDMLKVRQHPATVAEFLASDDMQALGAELELIHHESGGRGAFSLPPELGSALVGIADPVTLDDLFAGETDIQQGLKQRRTGYAHNG